MDTLQENLPLIIEETERLREQANIEARIYFQPDEDSHEFEMLSDKIKMEELK